MYKFFVFFINFFKNPIKNASLIPSSRFLARKMIKGIDFKDVKTIVELGPGTGVFTREIVKNANKNTKIILIELEKSYIPLLKKEFGNRVVVENASAHKMDEIVAKHRLEKVDLIVSGLGFLCMPKDVFNGIQTCLKSFTNKGSKFRTFTYKPSLFKKYFQGFAIQQVDYEIKNFPPATVFEISK